MRARRPKYLGGDDRAIEGLPIRLVIALVVGVAALSVMMSMLGGLDQFDDEELYIEFQGDGVFEEGDDVEVTVVDENGNGVEDATVVATEGTARIEGSGDDVVGTSEDDGGVILDDLDTAVPQGQEMGTIEFEIQPPQDSDYTASDDVEDALILEDS
ncbi:DUF7382 domain-containing protein [Natrialbaceae archaeon A-gly3]